MVAWQEVENSYTYQNANQSDRDKIRSAFDTKYGQIQETPSMEVTQSSSDSPDFIPGVQRGLQNLQASLYGSVGLAGGGLKKLGMEDTGQAIQDFGMEGYRRNVEEAKQYPKKYSFKESMQGKEGDDQNIIRRSIDWAQGTLGELIPSMVEAAAGAAIGSFAMPGAGTVTGGLAGRTVLKKGIEKAIQEQIKRTGGKVAEEQIRKQVTKQALKKLGGKAGMGAAVMPMESGGMYADLLESKGIDAPETALLFGSLATSMEFFGGNARLIDTFVDALSNGLGSVAKRSALQIAKSIPEEALQEGGQELMGILNTVANTDEKLLTAENVESIIESMAAGAVGGGAGAVVSSGINTQAANKQIKYQTIEEQEIEDRANTILSQDKERVNTSLNTISNAIRSNEEILGDYKKLEENAITLNVDPEQLVGMLTNENANNQKLIDRINEGVKAKEVEKQKEYDALSDEEKAAYDANQKLMDQRYEDAQKINQELSDIVRREDLAIKQYDAEKDPEKKKEIANRIFKLRNEKNQLTNTQVQQAKEINKFNEFGQPKKADELRQEKLSFYNQLWPGEINKNARRSAITFDKYSDEQQAILNNLSNQIEQTNDANRKQELQKLYEGLFQTFEKDVQESANVYTNQLGEVDLVSQTMDKMVQESDPIVRQKLYNQMFEQPGVKNAQESAELFNQEGLITQQGTPYKNRKTLEKKIESLDNPNDYTVLEVEDGFIGLQRNIDNIETSSFNNERQDGNVPQFQVGENQEVNLNIPGVTYQGKDALGLHQFITKEGRNFSSLTTDPDEIKQRYDTMMEAWKDQDSPKFQIEGNVFSKSNPWVVIEHAYGDWKINKDFKTKSAAETYFGKDTIKRNKYGQYEIEEDGTTHLIMRKNDLEYSGYYLPQFQTVYQGSPTRGIIQHDNAYIGSGEGGYTGTEGKDSYNGAYGYGHYFSGTKSIAEHYRKTLTEKIFKIDGDEFRKDEFGTLLDAYGNNIENTFDGQVALALLQSDFNKEDALNSIFAQGRTVAETRALRKAIEDAEIEQPGQLYKVDIPEDNELLDWNKPLKKQSEEVRDILKAKSEDAWNEFNSFKQKMISKYDALSEMSDIEQATYKELFNNYQISGSFNDNFNGEAVYTLIGKSLANANNSDWTNAQRSKATSAYLDSLGIKGIKYRAGEISGTADGSSNYVIFEGTNTKILDTFYQIREDVNVVSNVSLDYIKNAFKNQEVFQADNGTISVRFKNGQGLTINSIQYAGNDLIKLAIDTGQMSKNGSILGVTYGNEILLDSNFADNNTLWHENKHVLDNLGIITPEDNSALNKEFNKLRKANKLKFALSTHKDPKQAMIENRANMFAQIMTDREAYRNTTFGKIIQRVMDFFDKLFSLGQQSIRGLAREVESGKIYERQVGNQTIMTTVPQFEGTANKWYSELENTVNNFQQKQATPDQWKGMIKNRPGIKAEELDWIGLDEWLDGQDGKVTKDSLMKFIEENNVRLEEVIKQDQNATNYLNNLLEPYGYSYEMDMDGSYYLTNETGEGLSVNELPTDVQDILSEGIKEYANQEPTKYDEYQLSGGENYKELLLTMPQKENSLDQEAQKMFNKSFMDLSNEELQQLRDTKPNNYHSGHWDEPNILAHIRFNERTDADGNRVLFIEEVQSDWHQAGRKEGYGDNVNIRKDNNGFYRAYDNNNNPIELRVDGDVYTALNTEQAVRDALPNSYRKKGVPDAPYKKSWPLLAMKRMVRYAAENGFDKIAWTTGEQQADRYDLSSQIDSIAYMKNVNGNYNFHASKNEQTKLIQTDLNKEEIKNILGQELGQKIIDTAENKSKTLSGIDLRIGGEGMKGFYDKMLPSILNKEFNRGKWGKAKVEPIQISEGKTVGKGPWRVVWPNGDYELIYTEEEYNQIRNDRNYQSIQSLNVQPVESYITQLALPITNRMKSKALREGMPMFQVAEASKEQKIPQAQYDRIAGEKNKLLKDILQTGRMRLHDVKMLADKSLGSISTRLKNASQRLSSDIRRLDFNTSMKIVDALKTAKPLLEATKDMSPGERRVWDWARKNGDAVKINEIASKYGIQNNLVELRDVLNNLRLEAEKVGYDIGFIEEYWPRILKDREGFLQATEGISNDPVFTEAFRDQAKKLGISQEEFERDYPELKADIISNLILGRTYGIGGPGNIRTRVYDTIPEEYEKFYMDSDAALMQYIYSMTKKIEARKFFGKTPTRITNLKTRKKKLTTDLIKFQRLSDIAIAEDRTEADSFKERVKDINFQLEAIDQELNKFKYDNDYTENIGTYINDLMLSGELKKKDEQNVKDILKARFNEYGTTGIVNAYKNLAYIDTMGSPISALTQIGDLAWAMYVGKIWTPKGLINTAKNIKKATTGSFKDSKFLSGIYKLYGGSEITKEDLGIERIAQEFADGTTLGNAVSKVFKAVGLEKMDSIGKEVLINNAFDQYKAQAQTEDGRKSLLKELRPIFGNESNGVINDLLADNHTDNVKMLLYSKLLDFQPVALSEMPEYYLTGGNLRVAYMLKTYTLKQFDVFRREVWHNIKNGVKDGNTNQVLDGIKNMTQLMMLLTLANASADEIKDFMLGKETKFSDNVIENFLTIGGANRYVRMQTVREGIGSGMAGQILPPFKFLNAISKDITGDVEDGFRSVESIPIGGKLYYWRFGRGEGLKKSVLEKDFSKAGSDARKFKKQFDKAENKQLFAQSNLLEFKQMKLHENFQGSINRITATINKLKDMKQTTNVRKRIGQLENQKELVLQRYFDASESLNVQ